MKWQIFTCEQCDTSHDDCDYIVTTSTITTDMILSKLNATPIMIYTVVPSCIQVQIDLVEIKQCMSEFIKFKTAQQ